MRSFSIYTLGCKVNQEEGAAIAGAMQAAGFEEKGFADECDVYIINTCTVTHIADSKSRQMISRAVRKNPAALIVVTGCYAQTDTKAVAKLPGVDLICGNEEKAQLPALVQKALAERQSETQIAVRDIMQSESFVPMPYVEAQKRARAYLKIEDGCDQFCRYCIVPYARGPIRSLPVEDAVREASALQQSGHSEIVLSGIHVGAYGKDIGSSLCELLERLLQIDGILRIRLGSIEPLQVSDEIISLMQHEPRICHHLHIPLQSGSDNVLRAMGRNYDTAAFAALCTRLRSCFPDIAITTDIMAGFPGESDEDFEECAAFVERIAFASAHIFPYSRRQGTVAAELPGQIDERIKDARAKRLAEITALSREDFLRSFVGQRMEILPEKLIENEKGSFCFGHTSNFLPVLCADMPFCRDSLQKCRISDIENDRLLAVFC